MDIWPTNKTDVEKYHKELKLFVDKVILKNCRSILVDLSMAWTDIKYGSSFLNPKMFEGAAGNNTTLTNNSMANWRTALTSGGIELG